MRTIFLLTFIAFTGFLYGQNVGIGTAIPASKLEIQGDFRLSSSPSNYVNFALPASSQTTSYILPINAGQNGQLLQTNGTGTLGWTWGDAGNWSNVYAYQTSGTFTIPAGVTKIMVECVGGGGNNIPGSPGSFLVGGGGGGGGYAKGIFTVIPGTIYTVTVGIGGTGQTNSSLATSGGTSSFGSLIVAYGGGGGNYINAGLGGGGQYGIGAIIINGEQGNSGIWLSTAWNLSSGGLNASNVSAVLSGMVAREPGNGGKGGGPFGGHGG